MQVGSCWMVCWGKQTVLFCNLCNVIWKIKPLLGACPYGCSQRQVALICRQPVANRSRSVKLQAVTCTVLKLTNIEANGLAVLVNLVVKLLSVLYKSVRMKSFITSIVSWHKFYHTELSCHRMLKSKGLGEQILVCGFEIKCSQLRIDKHGEFCTTAGVILELTFLWLVSTILLRAIAQQNTENCFRAVNLSISKDVVYYWNKALTARAALCWSYGAGKINTSLCVASLALQVASSFMSTCFQAQREHWGKRANILK